jgi:hypothetical protein
MWSRFEKSISITKKNYSTKPDYRYLDFFRWPTYCVKTLIAMLINSYLINTVKNYTGGKNESLYVDCHMKCVLVHIYTN